ncbi:peptidoglycan DD-metalloendopeptidase family protein [Microbacterium sp. NPDC076911]|uniref:murein hydrolase activator EnvC family protein n=1 Tax=Microbacterium sp. NPDC076911 TaxID=3154958 RepID=UPI00343EB600
MSRRRARCALGLIAGVLVTPLWAVPAAAGSPTPTGSLAEQRAPSTVSETPPAVRWSWPLTSFQLTRAFVAPSHEYAPGHRGVDLRPRAGNAVFAPADGRVAFVGHVVDRAIITIDHGGGLVTTLEPVTSDLSKGATVTRQQLVGEVAVGGHTDDGDLHVGLRLHGNYINPALLVGEVPRAVLLPCCSASNE